MCTKLFFSTIFWSISGMHFLMLFLARVMYAAGPHQTTQNAPESEFKRSHGAKSGEYEGYSISRMCFASEIPQCEPVHALMPQHALCLAISHTCFSSLACSFLLLLWVPSGDKCCTNWLMKSLGNFKASILSQWTWYVVCKGLMNYDGFHIAF